MWVWININPFVQFVRQFPVQDATCFGLYLISSTKLVVGVLTLQSRTQFERNDTFACAKFVSTLRKNQSKAEVELNICRRIVECLQSKLCEWGRIWNANEVFMPAVQISGVAAAIFSSAQMCIFVIIISPFDMFCRGYKDTPHTRAHTQNLFPSKYNEKL